MTNKEFKTKFEVLKKILDSSCENYVFVMDDDENVSVAEKGTLVDLCYMAHELICCIRKNAEELVGKEGADIMVKGIIKTDEEIKDELEEREHSIPKYLRKLMDLEKELDEDEGDEDDTTDETDGDEEAGEEEDNGVHYRHDLNDGSTVDIRIRTRHDGSKSHRS